MTTLSKLKSVALSHFAKHGYDGASLAHIASDVGIKKQSIYTYFNGKDELFNQIFEDTCKQEILSIKNSMEQIREKGLQSSLYSFLKETLERFYQDDSTKFMLRNAFLPPSHLYEKTINTMNNYLDQLHELFLSLFQDAVAKGEVQTKVNVILATTAFIAVIDGLYVELLYGNEYRVQKRLEASWIVFWQGISDVSLEGDL